MSEKRDLLKDKAVVSVVREHVGRDQWCLLYDVVHKIVPHAIDRAISAEADNVRLRRFLEARFCKECPAEICGHSCVVNELLRGGHNA